MFEEQSLTKQFTDMMSEGFIFIDNKGRIQIYNNKAKEIFGIDYDCDFSHSSGKIEKGDIVIIGDSSFGKDDGGLTSEALMCIGIEDSNIKYGDAIIAVGTYGDEEGEPAVYKYIRNDYYTEKLEFGCNYANTDILGCIDFKNRAIDLTANNEKYTLTFINYIGHIVVLDGKTKNMKFYQTQGYTARGESIHDLLKGKVYRAKGKDSELFDVIGKGLFEIHNGNLTIKEFYDAAKGKDIRYLNQFKEINGKPTICSLFPVDRNGIREGAVLKIEDISEIKKIIKERDEAFEKLVLMERRLNEEESTKELLPEILGESREIVNVKKLAIRASKTNSTVLLLGESGTGKSLLAKAIHNNSKNKDKPFINVNCGSITETLLESELFGYEGGAFTGAKGGGKVGIFESAQGGTIFLDEIGEISPYLQVKLLQVLQDRTFYKVGGNKKIEVDMRIIVATNRNLEEEILKGNFREDLYYRINVFPIWIPPLRERKQDIYILVKDILPKICKRTGCEEKTISSEATGLLLTYDWPGNVRELENVLERAINLAEENIILTKHLSVKKPKDVEYEDNEIRPLKDAVSYAERKAIEKAISYFKGDKKAAMDSLKIAKTSFYEKLKKYNLDNDYSEF